MQNGETDPELLIQRVRAEVRRRKLALETSPVADREAASDSVPETIIAPATPQMPPGQPEQSDQLRGARLALERARSKQKKVRRWLPIIRRIRRNQGAINDSLIDAVQGHLDMLQAHFDTFQSFRGTFADLFSGLDHKLAKIREFIRTQERQTTKEQRQLQEFQQRLDEIRADAQKQQEHAARIESRLSAHQEQQKQELTEIQAFIAAQQKQTAEEHRQFDEQQRQIFDLTSKLIAYQEETGTRALRTTEQQQQHERRLSEIQAFIVAQQEQTKEVHRQFEQRQKETASVESRLNEHQEQQKQELIEIRDFIQAQQKQTAGEQRQLEDSQKQLSEIRTSILPNATLLRERINALQGSFDVVLDHFAKRKRPLSPSAARSLSEELQHQTTDDFYVAFENQFRGSREMIKERLTFYLPIIRETKGRTGDVAALDLGCGRGEWLELLKENGFDARGVDLNRAMVEECRSHGLEVECADANAYLRTVSSNSLSLITGFHIVEHLHFAELLDLLRQSFRVLRTDGCAIFETPNPECLRVTNYSFFLDPTHRSPIPQELLSFVAKEVGFNHIQIERLQPHFEEGILKGYLDYAGIFTK